MNITYQDDAVSLLLGLSSHGHYTTLSIVSRCLLLLRTIGSNGNRLPRWLLQSGYFNMMKPKYLECQGTSSAEQYLLVMHNFTVDFKWPHIDQCCILMKVICGSIMSYLKRLFVRLNIEIIMAILQVASWMLIIYSKFLLS